MPNLAIALGYGLYSAAEYFMGKSKYGSFLELIVETPIKRVIAWFSHPEVPPAAPAPKAPSEPKSPT